MLDTERLSQWRRLASPKLGICISYATAPIDDEQRRLSAPTKKLDQHSTLNRIHIFNHDFSVTVLGKWYGGPLVAKLRGAVNLPLPSYVCSQIPMPSHNLDILPSYFQRSSILLLPPLLMIVIFDLSIFKFKFHTAQ